MTTVFAEFLNTTCPKCGDTMTDKHSNFIPTWSDRHDNIVCWDCATTNIWSVWVGGSEINDNLLTLDEAKQVAEQWLASGYDDVHIDNGDN